MGVVKYLQSRIILFIVTKSEKRNQILILMGNIPFLFMFYVLGNPNTNLIQQIQWHRY